MYIESSSPRRPGDTAELISPLLHTRGYSRSCLSFRYHMHGATMGSLAVLQADTLLWKRSKSVSDQWQTAQVTMDTSSPTRVSQGKRRMSRTLLLLLLLSFLFLLLLMTMLLFAIIMTGALILSLLLLFVIIMMMKRRRCCFCY